MIRLVRPRNAVLAGAICGSLLLCSGCDGYTRLHGVIRDPNGIPISGALVVFNPKGSAYPKQTTSSADGTYIVGSTHAPFGHVPLTLVVSKDGYKTVDKKFKSGDRIREMDVVLLPAPTSPEKSPQSSTSK
jgi:Carboxypeptidase regulatory-like domain